MSRFSSIALTCVLSLALLPAALRAADADNNKSDAGTGTPAAGSGKLSSKETKFIKDAAEGGMEEVALGKLAAQKGSSDAIKSFGQKMVDDHSKANEQLMSLAQSKGVDLSAEKDATDKKIQKATDKLSKMEGADFDKAYAKAMVKDHQKDVKEFEMASKDAKDPDVKAFASQTLPILQDHLKMAQDLPGAGGSGSKSGDTSASHTGGDHAGHGSGGGSSSGSSDAGTSGGSTGGSSSGGSSR